MELNYDFYNYPFYGSVNFLKMFQGFQLYRIVLLAVVVGCGLSTSLFLSPFP
jgi:hypothetical protein